MWARARLHIGWSDLAYGLWSCLHSAPRAILTRRTEAYWSSEDDTLACFSVRSGFDLLLQALSFPRDSEILFSALNVKGMIKIARRHGLVPVPVDLDIPHMGPSLEALERAITPKTRAIVVAHLFGTRLDLDGVVELAKRHNLLILEDCAQAFDGHLYAGHPDSDVAMFSFGPLKTATALGGALLRIKDPGLLARMRQIQAGYPKQSRGAFLVRVLKFAGLKVITSRPVFAIIHRFFRAGGKDYEDSISNSVRGVAKLGSNKQLLGGTARPKIEIMAGWIPQNALRHRPGTAPPARRSRRAAGHRQPDPHLLGLPHLGRRTPEDDPQAPRRRV